MFGFFKQPPNFNHGFWIKISNLPSGTTRRKLKTILEKRWRIASVYIPSITSIFEIPIGSAYVKFNQRVEAVIAKNAINGDFFRGKRLQAKIPNIIDKVSLWFNFLVRIVFDCLIVVIIIVCFLYRNGYFRE